MPFLEIQKNFFRGPFFLDGNRTTMLINLENSSFKINFKEKKDE